MFIFFKTFSRNRVKSTIGILQKWESRTLTGAKQGYTTHKCVGKRQKCKKVVWVRPSGRVMTSQTKEKAIKMTINEARMRSRKSCIQWGRWSRPSEHVLKSLFHFCCPEGMTLSIVSTVRYQTIQQYHKQDPDRQKKCRESERRSIRFYFFGGCLMSHILIFYSTKCTIQFVTAPITAPISWCGYHTTI